MFSDLKSDLQSGFFLEQKKPLRAAEVLYVYFFKKNYNSVSAEGSGIIHDILQIVNFIFCFILMGQICELFFNQPNKNQNNFYYPIKIV
ncbi:hypothetical protein B0A71_00900 [Flavobacterium tructae]|uniref:Uncharacterized protein n=1 Tax=Flavobacterium tructae TaxID=1114873 RepID=A0A1S1J9B9_9FLAO|nr:hypothetical protein BHE19_00875 [Flavobacterium tructae]OXB22058.1 hypothetical protein B0A71_00900 [Flavobacterium tructae]